MASMGFFSDSAWSFIALYGVAGIAAAGQTPLIYCKVISARFDKKRGLALGIAIAGVGAGSALMPQISRALLQSFGWQGVYVGLGLITVLLALPAVAFLVTGSEQGGATGGGSDQVAGTAPGLTVEEAVKSRAFWLLAVSFFLVTLASAVVAHIVPMMTDRGLDLRMATASLSAVGIALLAGRLLAGYLFDHVFAPVIAIASFAAPAAGIAILLATNDATFALPAAVLVGLGVGAEIDLIAYLQSRYLGLRSFGEIYGYLFALFMLGSATGPFFVGMCYERHHRYAPALFVLLAGLLFACFLMTRLGSYAFGAISTGSGTTNQAAGTSGSVVVGIKSASKIITSATSRHSPRHNGHPINPQGRTHGTR